MSEPFVDQLADLCRTHVTRAKWVFVPAHSIGRTLGERLALEGTNRINLRFVTPLDIALRMGAPFLVERGIDPSEEGLGPALVMRLLLDLPEKGGYFRPLADQPSMAQALYATIRELRMAGVKAQDLRPDAFESSAKHSELVALLASYECFLKRNSRGDMAAVYEEGVKHPDWCPIQPEDCWIELPGATWTVLQQQLIDAMPGTRISPRALNLPAAKIPRRMSQRHFELVSPDPRNHSLAFLMSPADIVRTEAGSIAATIELFHAGGRDAEIEEVFRRILQAGVSLDQVEIACASEAYAPLVWEKALRHEWPVTIGSGLPAALTRPGRAVLAFCDWIESEFTASHLRRMLQSGDIRFHHVPELTTGQAARVLAKAEPGWGRATYELALNRLAKSYQRAAANADLSEEVRASAATKAARASGLLRWIEELLSSVPEEESDGSVALQDCVSAAIRFLEHSTTISSALDGAANAALVEEVTELRALGVFRCRLVTALRFIRERVEGLSVAADRPRAGHLHVCPLSQSGYASRPLAFVVGLEEGRVFPAAIEDPVLLDTERTKINQALRLSKDRVEEAVWLALTRLAVRHGSVVLSYSSRDLREYRETYASWLMLRAFRLKHRDPSKSYGDLHQELGRAKSCVPELPGLSATEVGWWLSSVKAAGAPSVPPLLKHFPALAQGRDAEAHRETAAFTEFDGLVPEAGKVLDPSASSYGVSVTSLEEAATCGFRYFLKRGLRLDTVDDGERDEDVWLGPLVRGAELHDLYAAAMRRIRDANRRPQKDDLQWLLDRADARLKELRVEMPPPSEEVFDRERHDLRADLELFVNEEYGGPENRIPIGFEVAFGPTPYTNDDEPLEPLGQSEPIEIDLGGGLKFRLIGRIDRIDQIGPSSFEIIDYKTGGYWEKTWGTGVFSGGTRLQHALYGLAASELLKRKYKKPVVTAGVYYFSSAKGGKERRVIPAPSKSVIAKVLGDLRDMIASGTFVHTGDENDCKYCEYGRACGAPVAVGRVGAKLADNKLVARRRLLEYE